MPYNGPVWQSTAGADKRGEIYMQAGQNIGNSLAQGIAAMGEKRKELASKAEAVQATEGAWDVLSAQHPDLLSPFEEKFRTGSAGAKQGILAQAIAAIGQKMEAGKEAESARRFGLDYGLRAANANNAAVYQQAQVDNMAADNSRQEKRLNYDLMPDNQKPVAVDMPGATAYVAQGTKSGSKVYQFIPKPKAPMQPGMMRGADGIGYFAGSDGRPVNPEYLLADPVAGAPRGNEMPLGTDLLPVPSDGSAAPDGMPVGPPLPGRPERLFPGVAAKDFVDRPYTTAVQDPDGTVTEKQTILRTYNDGRVLLLQPPNDANEAAGQSPEFKTIVPIRGQTLAPAPSSPAAPATAAPKPAKRFW